MDVDHVACVLAIPSKRGVVYGSAMSDQENENTPDRTLRQDLTADWFGDGEDRARLDPVSTARAALKPQLPKRFYREARIEARAEGHVLLLDGRVAMTKLRRPLAGENAALGAMLAEEWGAQGEQITPATMPITRILHAAIDHVADAAEEVRADIVKYAGSDLVCYRAPEPERLVERQSALWDPVLRHIEVRHGGRFILSEGIRFVEQPAEAIEGIRRAVNAVTSPAALAALHVLTTLSGSALIALAVADGLLDAEAGFDAGEVDADFETEIWGEDDEATERRRFRLADFAAATRIIRALAD